MTNSKNWVAQKDCPYTPGSVDVATGATPENSGDATFAQAFGAGPIEVYWALVDSSVTPRLMAGVGQLSGGSVSVGSPKSTFDGTTYDDAPSGPITLVSPVTIRCTLNAADFDALVQAAKLEDVTFPSFAGFNEGTAIGSGTVATNFASSNKQSITGSATITVGAWTFPAIGSYLLDIASTVTVSSIDPNGKMELGDSAYSFDAGRTHVLSIYWNGTVAKWMGSPSV